MANPDSLLKTLQVALIPGTGRMGKLLGARIAEAGVSVFFGSRDASKGLHASQLIADSYPSAAPHIHGGGSNTDAANWANVVFWCPSGSIEDREAILRSLAPQLENKIIVDVSNVMYFFDESQWGQTSAVLLNQKALGVPAKWTTAFKSTFWKLLEDLPDVNDPHCTFVAGDDEEAVATTIALVEAIPGFKAVKAGDLKNSKIIELLGPRWLFELDKLNGGGKLRSGWRYGL